MEKEIKAGDFVRLMDHAQIEDAAIDEDWNGFIFPNCDLDRGQAAQIDETALYEVEAIDEDGNLRLKLMPGIYPREIVESVIDGRVLKHSQLPIQFISTAQDDSDLLALAQRDNSKPVATLNLMVQGKVFGTVELSVDRNEVKLVNRQTGAPIRTAADYQSNEGGFIGRHAYVHAFVIPTGMEADKEALTLANMVLDLNAFEAIDHAWEHFSQERNALEALRICSLYHRDSA